MFAGSIITMNMIQHYFCHQKLINFHYANTPMQYTAIFMPVKMTIFIWKFFTIFLFLLKTLIVGTR